jgi:hypothetical protein
MNSLNTIGKYVSAYLWITFFYSFYSVILDHIFFNIDYGADRGFLQSISYYFFYFIIVFFPIAVPVVFFYNWIILNAFENLAYKHFIRLFFGIFIGLIIGLSMRRTGASFYIGHLRPLKNCILFSLVGVSIELIRIVKVKNNNRDRTKKIL